MSHIRSRTRFSHTLLAAGLAIAMTLAGTSALSAHGHNNSQNGHHNFQNGHHDFQNGHHDFQNGHHGPYAGSHSVAGLGHSHGNHIYQHNCYSRFGCGWTRRCWCPSLNCSVYWCPSEGCWYTYDAADETFTPCDDWTDENMSGLQYGP